MDLYIKIDTTKPTWFETTIRSISSRTGLAICLEHSYREQNNCAEYIGIYSNAEGKVYRGVVLKDHCNDEGLCITLHRIT